MNTEQLKLSVVVPVYNVEQYLPTMLDSILAQTFAEFELLLIDDGSTDGSGTLCDDYAARDARIRVVHKENGGVSAARNRGIEEARGEYLYFCDADDYLSPCLLEVMMGAINGRDYLRVNSPLSTLRKDFDPAALPPASAARVLQTADTDDQLRALFPEMACACYLWQHLYRRAVVLSNDLRLDTRFARGEDALFNFSYVRHIRSAAIADFRGYVYFQNPGSAVHDPRKINEIDYFEAVEAVWEQLESRFRPADVQKERTWVYSYLYHNMLQFAIKGYFPAAAAGRKERLRRWRQIARDPWFSAMRKADFPRASRFKIVENVCRLRLGWLVDPALQFLGRRNKIPSNSF